VLKNNEGKLLNDAMYLVKLEKICKSKLHKKIENKRQGIS
jgi:hypothetical protein